MSNLDDIGAPDHLVHKPAEQAPFRKRYGSYVVAAMAIAAAIGGITLARFVSPAVSPVIFPQVTPITEADPAARYTALSQQYLELLSAYSKATTAERRALLDKMTSVRAQLITLVNAHDIKLFPPSAERFVQKAKD